MKLAQTCLLTPVFLSSWTAWFTGQFLLPEHSLGSTELAHLEKICCVLIKHILYYYK